MSIPVNVLSPSILNADFSQLKNQIKLAESGGAHIFHLDIMDGQFVPNISFGPGIVQNVRRCTELPLDCHLMINTPEHMIPEFAKAGADIITVHYESTHHIDRLIHLIKDCGCQAGIALNPGTDVRLIEALLPFLDMVLVMTVNPGFGGQKFMPYCLDKVRWLRNQAPDLNIQVDGGINLNTLPLALEAGANNFVVGSAIFGQSEIQGTTQKFCALL